MTIPAGFSRIDLRAALFIGPPRKSSTKLVRTTPLSDSFRNRCKISLVSTGPQLIPSVEPQERNWLPLAIAAVAVLLVTAIIVLILQHNKPVATQTPVSAPLDSYAANLPITSLAMSEASNLSGGKATYLDGHIANTGSRTVTGITVQVLFQGYTVKVAQNVTSPLHFIRTREPYIDVEPVSAAPLKPGGQQDFRLIFDAVSDDWDGTYPQIRIVHVDTQ